MQYIRTFIAIEIPLLIKNKIADFQRILMQEDTKVKWVKLESMHITLKFLGEIDKNLIDDLNNEILVSVKNFDPFQININETGVFPNFKKPKIIWLGIKSTNNILISLATQIDNNINNLGFPKEKRTFKAHITLGRIKDLYNIDTLIKKLEQNSNFDGGIFTVKNIIIMQSELKPTGAVYTPLRKITI